MSSERIYSRSENRSGLNFSIAGEYRRVRDTVLRRFLPRELREFVDSNSSILGDQHLRSWSEVEQFLSTQVPEERTSRKRIVDRCNWQAELERATKLRTSRSEFAYEHLGYEQLKEFRTCIDTLYREFCLVEREYCYFRKVVRKKVGDTYLYKIVAFDPNDPVQASETSDQAFSRAGLVGMLNRGIEFSSIPERDRAYKDGFLEIYKDWIVELENGSEGSVHLHVSPPPSVRAGEMREGYGTHTFQNWNVSDRVDENTLLIHVVNLRTEYSLEQQLHMLGQILNGEQLETARGFQDDLKKERDVSLLDILRFPMRMPEACSKETMGAFLSGMYSLMGNSSEINSRNKDATERETRYLRMCLSNADIQEIRNKLEPVQEMYVKALISGAPVTTLKSIVNYLEHSANVLYAKYKYMQDLAEGIEGTSEAKYFALARENNGRGNDACPIQTNSVSEASIVLVEGGEFAIVDGERIHNPLIPCPDKACNKLFRVYDNGKRHKTCPHCGWDPCDPEKTGATYKSRLLLENKMKQSGLKEVRIIEPEVIIAPLKRRIEPESDVKPVVHSTDNLKRFRYVAELDMYYEIIFGQVYYFSPRQLQERSGIEAMNFV